MIRNAEALQERARRMSRIPRTIPEATVAGLDAACRTFIAARYTLADGVWTIDDPPHLLSTHERLRLLECLGGPNGLRLALVQVAGGAATLEVHFFNRNLLPDLLADASAAPDAPGRVFRLSGGHRLPAGDDPGRVRVVGAAQPDPAEPVLMLTVAPVGDYSTYTLHLDPLAYSGLDPLFSDLDFKFRPGCFTTDCAPDWDAPPPARETPAIDYLAKDYDGFRHTLIAWMMDRVPGWQATSEADLDHVLLSLFSAAADELSDFQDRVMNEAYLRTARRRVSLARHARLVDYHIHQGNQARTWLALEVTEAHDLLVDLAVRTGTEASAPGDVVFTSRLRRTDAPHAFAPTPVHPLLNRIGLYTWEHAVPTLAAGSTSADLLLRRPDGSPAADETSARDVESLLRSGAFPRLLVQEHLNPRTGYEAGRDPEARQLVQLLTGEDAAEARQDPMTGAWFVRVRWDERDALRRNFCFAVECPDGWREDVALFHGNLIEAFHGRVQQVVLRPEGAPLAITGPVEAAYARAPDGVVRAALPVGPLLYRDTPPGGERPPVSTLDLKINGDPWNEVISLVHSDDGSESGDHFVVETDEEGGSLIRFGNGRNGSRLPDGAVVHAAYQVGHGLDGNVGADQLVQFDRAAFPRIAAVWNPFDVTNGRAPEPAAEIIRRAPEAYRYRQLRAVTLADYVRRAEELPGVARAAARYAWTGSWRTVRLTIDPAGTTALTDSLREELAGHLDAVRLIGEDLEIRAPRFVPLEIAVALCIHPDFWPEDVRFVLEQTFSDGYTPDGRPAFFHPDRWTFGQALHASRLLGPIQAVPGVDHVISIQMKRWNASTPGPPDTVAVRAEEIILVENDPDHMERGRITFDIQGGRA